MRERVLITKPALREFNYRPNRLLLIVLLILCCSGEILIAYFAFHWNGVARARGFQFTEDQFRIFLGVFACLGPFGILLLAWLLFSSYTQHRRVALTADSLIIPKPSRSGMSLDEIEIPFAAIRSASVSPLSPGTRMLLIIYDADPLMILSTMFPSRREFDTLAEMVMAVVEKQNRAEP